MVIRHGCSPGTGRVRNVMIVWLRITRRDSPAESANFTVFLICCLPLFHHRESRLCESTTNCLLDCCQSCCLTFTDEHSPAAARRSRPAFLGVGAVHDGRCVGRYTMPGRPTRFAPLALESVYPCPEMSTRRASLILRGLFVAATLVAICPPQA